MFAVPGLLFIVVGTAVFFWAGFQLGLKRTWGIRFFDSRYKSKLELAGPYKILENPIYTGLFLFFLGFALFSNSLFFLLISVESYLLLNVLMAELENRELNREKKRLRL
jgi:protein-S-isoprenylcysteine O-methyltransferase Ste14